MPNSPSGLCAAEPTTPPTSRPCTSSRTPPLPPDPPVPVILQPLRLARGTLTHVLKTPRSQRLPREEWTAGVCIVHLIRNSFRYAGRQHGDATLKSLKPVYTAVSESAAKDQFAESAAKGAAVPRSSSSGNSWAELVPFLTYEVEIRRCSAARMKSPSPPESSSGGLADDSNEGQAGATFIDLLINRAQPQPLVWQPFDIDSQGNTAAKATTITIGGGRAERHCARRGPGTTVTQGRCGWSPSRRTRRRRPGRCPPSGGRTRDHPGLRSDCPSVERFKRPMYGMT